MDEARGADPVDAAAASVNVKMRNLMKMILRASLDKVVSRLKKGLR